MFTRSRALQTLIFFASLTWILTVEAYLRRTSPWQFYLQPWASDVMMQANRIIDLKTSPFRTLLCTGQQPPMLNLIRGFLALFVEYKDHKSLLAGVDELLYYVWALLYSTLNVLVFRWLRLTTSSERFAMVGTLIWALHPAAHFYSVLMEGTMLSTVAITWMLYELYRIVYLRQKTLGLEASSLFCFYTRTIFQWYFLPVLLFACWLGGVPRKRLIQISLICSLFAAPLLIKQEILYHTLSTTTFEGDHKLGLIWYRPSELEIKDRSWLVKHRHEESWPETKLRAFCNQPIFWNINIANLSLFNDYVKEHPLESAAGVWRSVQQNFTLYGKPSSSFTASAFLVLPWKSAYDYIFSEWRLLLMLAFSVFAWGYRAVRDPDPALRFAEAGTLALISGFIFLISILANRYEWTESNRLKFFLEPAFFVFFLTQLKLTAGALRK